MLNGHSHDFIDFHRFGDGLFCCCYIEWYINKPLRIDDALKIATFFGLFQAIMPLIGWIAGLGLIIVISSIDHWIAFGLLCLIGVKMIYEAIKIESIRQKKSIENK